MDALWPAFIVVCALAGIGLAILWIRVQRRPEKQLERLEQRARELQRRQRHRSGAPTGPGQSPPPPTPDLVSVQEAWRDRADTDEVDRQLIGLGPQTHDDPSTPRKALPGMQGLIPGATPRPRGPSRGPEPPEGVE